MGSVLGPFGAFQGNIWSVAPFIPVGPSKNQWKKHKKCKNSKTAQQKWMKLSGCLSLGPWSLSPRAGRWGIFGAIEMFRHDVLCFSSISFKDDFDAWKNISKVRSPLRGYFPNGQNWMSGWCWGASEPYLIELTSTEFLRGTDGKRHLIGGIGHESTIELDEWGLSWRSEQSSNPGLLSSIIQAIQTTWVCETQALWQSPKRIFFHQWDSPPGTGC